MAYEDDQAIAEMMPTGSEPMPAEGGGDLAGQMMSAMKEMSASWKPETPEGQRYKDELDATIARFEAMM